MCFLNGRDKSPNKNLNGDFNRETREKKKTDYFSRHLAYFAVIFFYYENMKIGTAAEKSPFSFSILFCCQTHQTFKIISVDFVKVLFSK